MRLNSRLAIALAAIVIFSGSCAFAQSTDKAFNEANKAEQAHKWDDALKAYRSVASDNQRKNPALAARALYEAGLFAKDRYGAGDANKHREGQDQAITLWKQLENDHPKEAGELLGPAGDGNQLQQLEAVVDKRNSSDWKYQIIDGLVRLTGKNPDFSYAVALVLLAGLAKLILLPFSIRQYAAMREMQRMQPHLKKLQERYKGQELQVKSMELYKEHGVNPFASCLPTLLQLPFLFGVYAAIREYQFALVHGKFLWVGSTMAQSYPGIVGKSLGDPDTPLLIIYTITNWATMRMTPATSPDPQQVAQQKQMAVISSVMFLWFFFQWKFPSGFLLYWLALNAFSIIQQYEYVIKPQRAEAARGQLVPETGPAPKAGNNGNGTAKDGAKANPPARVRPRKKNRR